ncbi:unnamed protein product [Mycena citricolor]|uniref:Uncharacterized protein n=1 Tax=Mycena citricolor TaxID=2018698 RepID=A0AAD2Q5T0_9AGAR|nr:unnamed protein product [Mycena citricolor]
MEWDGGWHKTTEKVWMSAAERAPKFKSDGAICRTASNNKPPCIRRIKNLKKQGCLVLLAHDREVINDLSRSKSLRSKLPVQLTHSPGEWQPDRTLQDSTRGKGSSSTLSASLLTEDAVRLFDVLKKKFADTQYYVAATKKFGSWLNCDKAYYFEARPEIVNILLITQRTLGEIKKSSPAEFPKYAQAYTSLITILAQFTSLFVEPELQQTVQTLVRNAKRLELSLSQEAPTPQQSSHDVSPNTAQMQQVRSNSSSLASALTSAIPTVAGSSTAMPSEPSSLSASVSIPTATASDVGPSTPASTVAPSPTTPSAQAGPSKSAVKTEPRRKKKKPDLSRFVQGEVEKRKQEMEISKAKEKAELGEGTLAAPIQVADEEDSAPMPIKVEQPAVESLAPVEDKALIAPATLTAPTVLELASQAQISRSSNLQVDLPPAPAEPYVGIEQAPGVAEAPSVQPQAPSVETEAPSVGDEAPSIAVVQAPAVVVQKPSSAAGQLFVAADPRILSPAIEPALTLTLDQPLAMTSPADEMVPEAPGHIADPLRKAVDPVSDSNPGLRMDYDNDVDMEIDLHDAEMTGPTEPPIEPPLSARAVSESEAIAAEAAHLRKLLGDSLDDIPSAVQSIVHSLINGANERLANPDRNPPLPEASATLDAQFSKKTGIDQGFVLARHHPSSKGQIKIEVSINSMQAVALNKWNRRSTNPDEVDEALCISLLCFLASEVSTKLEQAQSTDMMRILPS